ncbi:hypothetical protein BBJ28_00012678 [Nothophytophthora sp. Chile5]|nr:hypothetical protein BBJ28_00012678 [Nothophytophthora sp. Chile5]
MLSMLNSSQRVANAGGSGATSSGGSAGGSMSAGASVAHTIASLAGSASPEQQQRQFRHVPTGPPYANQPHRYHQAFALPISSRGSDFEGSSETRHRLNDAASTGAAPKKRSTKSKCSPGLRSGKWTAEEEAFTNMIIHFFKRGLLDVEDGTSLRWYLAKRLNCEAMRVTKKLKGNSSIGKQIFRAMENTHLNRQAIRRARDELSVLETRFLESLSSGGAAATAAVSAPASSASSAIGIAVRGRKILPTPKFKQLGDGSQQTMLAPLSLPSDSARRIAPDPKVPAEDANLLLHFFSEAHDATVDESEPESGSLSVDLSAKLGKKRPLASMADVTNRTEDEARPEQQEPPSKRQAVKIKNLMD